MGEGDALGETGPTRPHKPKKKQNTKLQLPEFLISNTAAGAGRGDQRTRRRRQSEDSKVQGTSLPSPPWKIGAGGVAGAGGGGALGEGAALVLVGLVAELHANVGHVGPAAPAAR